MINKDRFNAVLGRMKQYGLKQILVTDDYSMLYLIGRMIHPLERAGALLIKDSGEVHAYMNNLFCFEPDPDMVMHYYADGENVYGMIADELEPGDVGFDKEWPAKHVIRVLMERDDINPVLGSDPVDMARAVKDEQEKEALRHAGKINDMTMEYALSQVGPDVTEAEMSDMIEKYFEANGGVQDIQFQLACYGANAAEPHHISDGTKVNEGDAVLLDIWCPINNYWCDMTRTVFYKCVSDEHREIYEIVKRAQQAAIDFVRPGVKMSDVDAVARGVITDAGYGEYFLTRTGHGVGLTVHEPPFAASDSEVIAEPGMCFSIEPGIYLKDDVGVRIEDLVIVTDDGCEVLTKYPKDLQVVG